MLRRANVFVCAVLVWVVIVAGVIGGVVPAAEASVARSGVSSGSAASLAGGGQVESLALARFGRSAGSSSAGASLGGPAEVGVVPFDIIDVQRDPSEFDEIEQQLLDRVKDCLLYTSPSPRDS